MTAQTPDKRHRKAKKPIRQFALFNYDTLIEVGYYRRQVVKAGIDAVGERDYRSYIRRGVFRIAKVEVREIK